MKPAGVGANRQTSFASVKDLRSGIIRGKTNGIRSFVLRLPLSASWSAKASMTSRYNMNTSTKYTIQSKWTQLKKLYKCTTIWLPSRAVYNSSLKLCMLCQYFSRRHSEIYFFLRKQAFVLHANYLLKRQFA